MKIDKRRRIENKTNYKRRLGLLKGRSPRLVVRKTNKYIIVQIITSKHAADKVLFNVNSKELLQHGWPKDAEGSLKSLAAAYLTGILIAKKAKGLKERVILDIGLNPNTKQSRIYSVAKGVQESGIEINLDKESAPTTERINTSSQKINAKTIEVIKNKI